MTIKKKLANKKNYGSSRQTNAIKYIVIHYTGNDGDTDESNGKYFANNVVKASAHYFADDDSITQSVPDDYVAWSVGGSKYSDCAKTGGGKFYNKVTNTNSISIEICDTVKNGIIYPTDKTINNVVELVKSLMTKYNIPISNVIRHFDVNGKHCPVYWMDNSKWQSEFLDRVSGKKKELNPYTIPIKNVKKGDKGDNVKWVQWQLISKGYLPKYNAKGVLNVDGVFGNDTYKAVVAFQKDAFSDKKEWDGIVGFKTINKLK